MDQRYSQDKHEAAMECEQLKRSAIPPFLSGGYAAGRAILPKNEPIAAGRSEIAREIAEQEKGLQILHDTIAQLEKRLEPVLSPAPQNESGPGTTLCATQLGSAIASNNRRILAAIERLGALSAAIAL